uniref:EF-hand domain-containing protein n=1 Tax=Macrostomum lignano TaxID=282301 RepID=A0A1I8F5R2_9PLAT
NTTQSVSGTRQLLALDQLQQALIINARTPCRRRYQTSCKQQTEQLKRKLTFLSLANAEFTGFNSAPLPGVPLRHHQRRLHFRLAAAAAATDRCGLSRPCLAASPAARREADFVSFRLFLPEQPPVAGTVAEEAAQGVRRRSPRSSARRRHLTSSLSGGRGCCCWTSSSSSAVPAASRKPPAGAVGKTVCEDRRAAAAAVLELLGTGWLLFHQSQPTGADTAAGMLRQQKLTLMNEAPLTACKSMRAQRNKFLQRLEKRLTLTEQRQNSGEGAAAANSSSSKEATSQAVSARPSLTQSIDPNRIPDEPWLENNWEINPEAYENLCRLYKQRPVHQRSRSSCRLMFFLSYASKEQLEETVFRIMHCFRMQRPMSCHLINLISECDRSGSGLLDVYDFSVQQMEQLECTQAQPPMERERAEDGRSLLEANDLQSWSWDIARLQLDLLVLVDSHGGQGLRHLLLHVHPLLLVLVQDPAGLTAASAARNEIN